MSAENAFIVRNLVDIEHLPADVASLKGDGLGDSEVLAIVSLRSLRELDLSGCDAVTDRSVAELRHLLALEKLDLSFCNQITDVSLAACASLPTLRSVNLNWCYAVTDAGLARLAQCKSLELISLRSCEEITDKGIVAISGLPGLKGLELPEFAQITDEALSALSSAAIDLQALRLDHLTGISDKGVALLGKLRRLRILKIQSCPNVSSEAIADLKKLLPQCQISFGV